MQRPPFRHSVIVCTLKERGQDKKPLEGEGIGDYYGKEGGCFVKSAPSSCMLSSCSPEYPVGRNAQ